MQDLVHQPKHLNCPHQFGSLCRLMFFINKQQPTSSNEQKTTKQQSNKATNQQTNKATT